MQHNRIQSVQQLLIEHNVDALLISSLPNLIYLTEFAGFTTEDRDGFVLVTQKKQFLFTHALYQEAARKYMHGFIFIPITRDNPISEALKDVIESENITKLGYEAHDMTVAEYHQLIGHVDEAVLSPEHLIERIRVHKSPEEMQKIHTASELGDRVLDALLPTLSEGLTEQDVATRLELLLKKQGVNPSFHTIVAFGSNAALPHHVPTDRKLKKDEFVLLDFGVRFENYCSDMTRTVCFGTPTKAMQDVYETVYDAQLKAIGFLKDKLAKGEEVTGSDVDKVARDHILAKGFPEMIHSLGHGIGLEVHELPSLSPRSKVTLTEGMVFSIEPGIYLPTDRQVLPKGIGVRIEDLFAIKDKKLLQLTNFPRELVTI